MSLLKRLIQRRYAQLAPALDLAGEVYARSVIGYEAFDRHNAAIVAELGPAFGEVLAARSTFELWRLGKRFESDFARFCNAPYAVGTASGTAALQIALAAHDIGPGDEVITSAHTFVATVLAIVNIGATPVLVDVDPRTLLITADGVARARTARTRAIVPVHMHGHLVDIAALQTLGLPIIEDCAQATGASHMRPVPLGETGCFSFFASKPLGGAGNGGMIVTHDPDLAARCDGMRDPEGADPAGLVAGRTPSYIDPLEAAILRAKLPHIPAWRERRAANAQAYAAALGALNPAGPGVGTSGWYSFVVRVNARDGLKRALLRQGIETKVEYPVPAFRAPVFGDRFAGQQFPVAEQTAEQGLSLPLHAFLRDDERTRIIKAVQAAGAPGLV